MKSPPQSSGLDSKISQAEHFRLSSQAQKTAQRTNPSTLASSPLGQAAHPSQTTTRTQQVNSVQHSTHNQTLLGPRKVKHLAVPIPIQATTLPAPWTSPDHGKTAGTKQPRYCLTRNTQGKTDPGSAVNRSLEDGAHRTTCQAASSPPTVHDPVSRHGMAMAI